MFLSLIYNMGTDPKGYFTIDKDCIDLMRTVEQNYEENIFENVCEWLANDHEVGETVMVEGRIIIICLEDYKCEV